MKIYNIDLFHICDDGLLYLDYDFKLCIPILKIIKLNKEINVIGYIIMEKEKNIVLK